MTKAHYDSFDNMICVLKGTKDFLLYPPWETHLISPCVWRTLTCTPDQTAHRHSIQFNWLEGDSLDIDAWHACKPLTHIYPLVGLPQLDVHTSISTWNHRLPTRRLIQPPPHDFGRLRGTLPTWARVIACGYLHTGTTKCSAAKWRRRSRSRYGTYSTRRKSRHFHLKANFRFR